LLVVVELLAGEGLVGHKEVEAEEDGEDEAANINDFNEIDCDFPSDASLVLAFRVLFFLFFEVAVVADGQMSHVQRDADDEYL
jgi:hypothetical protein